ncbi:MAG TPA: murein biosynthesis integral membrane protein MurJ [Candidatus Paceibacterota bacterium]|nr:murein biosynthesis integral membrane protein MurJ [Candidatus Paceibacterota bacterium]
MVSKLLKLLNKDITSMNQAALVLAVFSVLSQLLGLFRDRFLASVVGPSAPLDVYYASFRAPDFIYNAIASLFSVTVLIPFITSHIKKADEQKMNRFSDSLLSVYFLGMIVVSGVAFVLMPYIAHAISPGFSLSQHADLVTYTRIMLLSPVLFGLSSLLSAFTQVKQKFLSFALAPLLYNIGIVVGIVFFYPLLGILGVIFGVILGAILHVLIQIPSLLSVSRFPKFTKNIDWKIIKEVVKQSLPRTLGLSISNLTFITMSAIASLLVVGSISIFQLSYNIQTTPMMIIGISYAVAAFPTLTKLFSEDKKEEFMSLIHRATRNILFFSIPCALFFIVLRAQIVRLLLGTGVFSWNDTRLVAGALALFSISITAQSLILILVRGFYAKGNTKTPLKINFVGLIVTICSSTLLLLAFENNLVFQNFITSLLRVDGVSGASVLLLPLGFSIGQIVNAILLWVYFHKENKTIKTSHDIRRTLLHTLGAGIISATGIYIALSLLGIGVDQATFVGVLLQGVLSGLFGLAIYAGVLVLLKNEDIWLFVETVKTKFWKAKPIVPEQTDL